MKSITYFTLMKWMTVHMHVWCAPLLAIQDFKMCAKPYEQIISLLKRDTWRYGQHKTEYAWANIHHNR